MSGARIWSKMRSQERPQTISTNPHRSSHCHRRISLILQVRVWIRGLVERVIDRLEKIADCIRHASKSCFSIRNRYVLFVKGFESLNGRTDRESDFYLRTS